jgi:hypothetical protein
LLCVKAAQCNGRKFHDGFGWVPKLRHCYGFYNKGWVYGCFRSSKGGHLYQEFVIKLGLVPSGLLLWRSIVRQ